MAKATSTRTSTKRKASDEVGDESYNVRKRRQPITSVSKITDPDEDDAGFSFTRPAAAKAKKTFAAPTRSSPRNHTKTATTSIGTTPRASRRSTEPVTEPRSNGSDSFVALPVSDTPIIRKNQQLRQNAGDGRRRSSLSMRGKRASSMGNGFQSLPHPDIPASEFHKHISEDLPDPVRMKQLLAWCMRRCIDEAKSRSSMQVNQEAQDLQANNIARTIEEEVLKDLIENRITTSWYHQPDQPVNTLQKKPHPQNVNNAAKMKELEERIAKLQAEEATWNELIASHTQGSDASQAKKEEEEKAHVPRERFAKTIEPMVDLDLLSAQEAEFMHSVTTRSASQSHTSKPQEEWLREGEANLEFQVDTLMQSLHQHNQFLKQADSKTTSLLEGAAKVLAAVETRENRESQARGIGTIDILRQISRNS